MNLVINILERDSMIAEFLYKSKRGYCFNWVAPPPERRHRMKKVVIYGTGSTGRRLYRDLKNSVDIIAFLDSNQEKWGGNRRGTDCRRL